MSLPQTPEVRADFEYARSYGEKQLILDLEQYEQVIGEDWYISFDKEQPLSLEEFHKRALKTLSKR